MASKKKVTVNNSLDDYFGSSQYVEDVREFVAKSGNKTSFGGQTKDGYTHFLLLNGEKVSIPVGTRK